MTCRWLPGRQTRIKRLSCNKFEVWKGFFAVNLRRIILAAYRIANREFIAAQSVWSRLNGLHTTHMTLRNLL